MLNMRINRPMRTGEPGKAETAVEFSGDLQSLLVELTYGIAVLYTRLKYSEPHGSAMADTFHRYLIHAMISPDSPIWSYTADDLGGVGITIVEEKGGSTNA